MPKIKYFEAIKEAQTQIMHRDKSVIIMGLGVNDPKGIFGISPLHAVSYNLSGSSRPLILS